MAVLVLGFVFVPDIAGAKKTGVSTKSIVSMAVVDGKPLLAFTAWGTEHPGMAYQLAIATPRVYPPVTPLDWELSLVQPGLAVNYTDQGSTYNWLAMAQVNGAPACLFEAYAGLSASELYKVGALAYAGKTKPTRHEDWSVVAPMFPASWPGGRYAITALNDKPFMVCLNGRTGTDGARDFFGIRAAWSNTPHPASVQDLTVTDVVELKRDNQTRALYGIALVVVDGLPVVAYCAPGVSIASPAAPDKIGEPWEQITLRSTASQNVGLCLCGDSLYILCLDAQGALALGRCAISEIKHPASWRWSVVDRNVDSYAFSIAALGDRLGVAYLRNRYFTGRSLDVAIAKVDHPDSPRDWWKSHIEESTGFMKLEQVDGKPVIGFLSPYAVRYAYASRPDPRSSRDWQVTTVFEDQAFTREKRTHDRISFEQDNQYTLRGFLSNPVTWAMFAAVLVILSVSSILAWRLRKR